MQSSGGAGQRPPEYEQVSLTIPGIEPALALCVHGLADQFVSRRIREEGIWEPYETALVMESLHPGDVFVDIGANIGYFTVLAAHLVGAGGQVFAFEPDPANCALLRQSLALNALAPAVEVTEAALSNEPGEGVLYLSADNLGDHQVYATKGSRQQVPIALLNGSDYLAPQLTRIDLVKIDTQGSEFQVVQGLMPLLEALAVKPRMLVELTPFSLRAAGASGRALVELLAQIHQVFWIVDHIEHRLVPTSAAELALWCDNVDGVPEDEGFMNIFLGDAPSKTPRR